MEKKEQSEDCKIKHDLNVMNDLYASSLSESLDKTLNPKLLQLAGEHCVHIND